MHIPHTRILDSDSKLAKHFLPHQIAWIQAEQTIHDQQRQVVALAEKSVRIGWTYADAFKNVRKRLWFDNRDYLFATKDLPSALEYVKQCYKFAEIFNLTRFITRHDEEDLPVNRLDEQGRPSSFTEHVKTGVIKFDNGSRIIAFSSNPQAMAVYGGDVGLDEFAKHPNARLLWETAQGRVAWGYDMAAWSSHDGEDTLFHEFAQQARAACGLPALGQPAFAPGKDGFHSVPDSTRGACEIQNQNSKIKNPSAPAHPNSALRTPHSALPSPWNLYFRVTMPDAIQLGLVETINRARGVNLSRDQFLADCKARAASDEIYEQAYLCNPMGTASNHIVEWSAIERCRFDYTIERLHLEAGQIRDHFGDFSPSHQHDREYQIGQFLREKFPLLFNPAAVSAIKKPRLGFDLAASGEGDLAVIYIDEAKGNELSLRALFTCRTEDWHFLKTVLFFFLQNLRSVQAAGDETGLGRQICWEAAKQFSSRFSSVNFSSEKHDLGFALMNQLSVAEKRFPRSEQDVAADYFALRKAFTGSKWVFSEGRNTNNPVSHCDIAWAGALASHAHTENKGGVCAAVLMEDGTLSHSDDPNPQKAHAHHLMWCDDPRIWRPFRF